MISGSNATFAMKKSFTPRIKWIVYLIGKFQNLKFRQKHPLFSDSIKPEL